MGFGAAAIIVFGGFVHSIYYGVRESTIRSQVGHIQIYRRGYSEKGNLAPFDYLIADYPALRDELRRIEHVKMVTARLGFSGLVSTGDTTTAVVEAGEVQSVVLLLHATDNTAAVRESLERLIRNRGLDLEIKTWEDLALRYHQVRELFGRIFAVLTLIVSIMVVFGITNTMTMAIFERTREIGTVMALGTRRRGVVSMFVLEGFVLGVLGAVAGVVLGVALAKAISTVGIQLPPPPGSTRGFMVQIFVVPAVLAQAFQLSIVAATLASLYPAWRAARLDVVEALRHV